MRKFLLLLLAALTLGSPAGALLSAPARSYEARQLKKQHKAQRKDLKQQQRAMNKIMDQHGLSDDQRKRFKNEKDDSRRQAQKAAKAASRAA